MYCRLNKMHSRLCLILAVLCIGISTFPASAATKTKQQTVDIESQYLLLDENAGISTYKGNVLFKKETLVIKADTITLYYSGDKLSKVLIEGSPADVRHEPDNEAKVHSQAKKMEYLVAEDKLLLTGQAFVNQGNQHFSCESIEYDTRQRIISAAGNQAETNNGEDISQEKATSSRVHVIIGPGSDNNGSDNNDAVNNDSEN